MSHDQTASYGVSEPEKFSQLIAGAIGRRGSALAAARAAHGLKHRWCDLATAEKREVRATQRMLCRYATEGPNAVNAESRRRLVALLTREERDTLDRILLPDRVRARLAVYQRWLKEQMWPEGEEIDPALSDEELERKMNRRIDRQIELEAAWRSQRNELLTHISREHPNLARRLRDVVNKAGVTPDSYRAWIALRAVLDPLLQFGASGGVERHWSELTHAELKRYLKAAIQVQEVLLRRSGEIARAQGRPAAEMEFLRPASYVIRDQPPRRVGP